MATTSGRLPTEDELYDTWKKRVIFIPISQLLGRLIRMLLVILPGAQILLRGEKLSEQKISRYADILTAYLPQEMQEVIKGELRKIKVKWHGPTVFLFTTVFGQLASTPWPTTTIYLNQNRIKKNGRDIEEIELHEILHHFSQLKFGWPLWFVLYPSYGIPMIFTGEAVTEHPLEEKNYQLSWKLQGRGC
jgi:hypothetical protein